uniref:Fibroblast growth factor n=1 Tax=Nothobranchius furzeri TaxID=105023 RepID=A0A8C6P201_NOTFU
MNVLLYFLTFAQLFCVAAAAERVSVELLQQRIGSGRRTCRLYCRVGIGFHLQIHTDGRVNGSHEPNQLSVLELFAISQGVIGIKGVYSKRFLAMNKRGRLHATEIFSDDCKFRERFQENSYNTYASVVHKNQRTDRLACTTGAREALRSQRAAMRGRSLSLHLQSLKSHQVLSQDESKSNTGPSTGLGRGKETGPGIVFNDSQNLKPGTPSKGSGDWWMDKEDPVLLFLLYMTCYKPETCLRLETQRV